MNQLLAAARYRAPWQRPLGNLLLLGGAGDQLVDSRCSLQLAAQWAAPVMLHPAAGHDLPLDDEAWVLAQIRGWLGPPGAES